VPKDQSSYHSPGVTAAAIWWLCLATRSRC